MIYKTDLYSAFKIELFQEAKRMNYTAQMIEQAKIILYVEFHRNGLPVLKQKIDGDLKSVILTINGLDKIEKESKDFMVNIESIHII